MLIINELSLKSCITHVYYTLKEGGSGEEEGFKIGFSFFGELKKKNIFIPHKKIAWEKKECRKIFF